MNNNKVSNPKVEVPMTPQMNDKDYITTILTVEKAMVKNLVVSLTEASNNELYQDFYDMFKDAIEIQREIYNLMFKKGWYQLEIAEETKITEKLNQLSQELSHLKID